MLNTDTLPEPATHAKRAMVSRDRAETSGPTFASVAGLIYVGDAIMALAGQAGRIADELSARSL